jgi:hypothetical protein
MKVVKVNRFKLNPQLTTQVWIVNGGQGCGKTVLLHSIFKAIVTTEPRFSNGKIVGMNIPVVNGYDITCDGFDSSLCREMIGMARNFERRLDLHSDSDDSDDFDHAWDTIGRVAHQQLHLYCTDNGQKKIESLEAWVSSFKENSVIVLDNLADGLSRDNQYNVIRWLRTWNPTAQFIITFHEYNSGSLAQANVLEM